MKATHKGQCQICGSTQMLPYGRLAKHGYTTRWGFFSGVCNGAHGLPFEQSTDLIAAGIASQLAAIGGLENDIRDLENIDSAVNGKTTAWAWIYTPSGKYQWLEVEVVDFSSKQFESGSTCYYASAMTPNGKAKRIEAYHRSFELSSVRHWVHFLNCKRAAALRKDVEGRKAWIAWQQDRVANWVAKPLTPR